ncbi:MAG: glycosyltransferase [Actinobacteria bacterium]|nr:glycosyltransferase [Actinomycetota bacterium]MCA1721961.1 glycosyltransferase [Actinomycetota bacterium]
MRIVVFCHSLMSDWNHGNAHFLRGVVTELQGRGHDVRVFEPLDAWSRVNLVHDQGRSAIDEVMQFFPTLRSTSYDPLEPDVPAMTEDADLVLVHEWNEPELVAAVGAHKAAGGYRLLFHDTHHRAVTAPDEMARFDLRHYDGVLAFGEVIRELYLKRGWAERAWTWHEAADVRVFHPLPDVPRRGDLVWIGNWGDGERTAELHEYLLGPVKRLGLQAVVHGVRYPDSAKKALADAGIRYGGWRANHKAPQSFAAHAVTVHVPRRPYVEALPGIPTIRPFEALACGIPLISAPWDDAEGLFTPGEDFLVASSGRQMERHLDDVLHDAALAKSLRDKGIATIAARHTCAHRVDELLEVAAELGVPA